MSPTRLLLLSAFTCVALRPALTARAAEPAAPPPTPPPTAVPAAPPGPATRPPGEVERLFRFHAGAQAQALRDAVDRASFDETLRDELRLLVREHLRRVDEGAARAADRAPDPAAPAAPAAAPPAEPLDDLLDRAADLARDFNDRQVAGWLDEHPSAYQPVQEQIALAEAYERATADEPDAVVRAARAAGLPHEREAALRKIVTDVHERLARADAADARRLREAEEKAFAAAPPPQAPSHGEGRREATGRQTDPPAASPPAAPSDRPPEVPTSFPRREDGKAAPRGVTPPPPQPPAPAPGQAAEQPPPPRPSPEIEKLQLLDALTFADGHARLTAAAREVRAEVEKLFPQPPQRKALDEEMLRWYQTYVPPDDASRDAPPAGAPVKPGASGDPGF